MTTRQDKAREVVRQMKAQQREATADREFKVGDTIKDLSGGQWWRVMDIEYGVAPGEPFQVLRCGLLSEGEDAGTFATFSHTPPRNPRSPAPLATICHWDDYEGLVLPVPYPKD